MNYAAYLLLVLAATALLLAAWYVHHQLLLRRRARLMLESIRNHDFTFRLSTRGLPPGERAMQEALNRLGTTIQEQVRKNEVEAWERMTRVLTHEIMNAVAPIASISQSLLGRNDVRDTPLEEGIQAIHVASTHLNTFVDSYRKLSQLQQPVMDKVDVDKVVAETCLLFPKLKRDIDTAGAEPVRADASMLRQVLVNLMKNAMEASATTIIIRAEGTKLHVGNNGRPIPPADSDLLFVPFFTTKRSGNGVGLSLSRRIMVQQGGMLELTTTPHYGCHVMFTLTMEPYVVKNR